MNMSHNERSCFGACSCLGLVISLFFGAIVGVLFALDYIPFITTIVWVVFGLAVLTLILLVAGVYLGAVSFPDVLKRCLSANALCLLAGTIGTILAAIVALSVVLNPALLAVDFIISILAFFFALMIIGLISLIYCIVLRLRG